MDLRTLLSEFDYTKMTALIDYLRAKGVYHFEVPGLKLTVSSEAPRLLAPEPIPVAESVAESKKEVKAGRDGLTPEQQMDYYGRVLDAEG